MVTVILYDEQKRELLELKQCLKDTLAMKIDDESRVYACSNTVELRTAMDTLDISDAGLVSFEPDSGSAVTQCLRHKYPSSVMMLVVDESVSPRNYIRPGMLFSSVLIRPYTRDEMQITMREFIDDWVKYDTAGEEVFVIESKDGITKIPYDRISYFEASVKKVYVRLQKEEYGFYDTLDDLTDRLPDRFVRCHRSYIVNMKKVRKYSATDNELILDDDMTVPVSRSYRGVIREILK